MIRHAQPIARTLIAATAAVGFVSGGLAVRAPAAGSAQAQAVTFGQTRTIAFYHIHTKETLTVTYKRDGEFVPDALEKINWIMRDWRENQATKMDPNTIDIIWEMHEELGSKEPVHIICGYRSRGTNEMLRRTRGGQASQSQHITGKAIDITFPDVPLRRMRYSAMIRERGGVGYYPTSGVPFVHVDTSRVRHWPRMVRDELALVFPSGRSQHQPADGGPLTPGDVAKARSRSPDLAREVTAFFDLRNSYGTRPAVMVADAGAETAPKPVLKREATPAPRPQPVAAVAKAEPLEGRMAVGAPPPDAEALVWTASVRPGGDDAEALPPQAVTANLVAPPQPAKRPKDASSKFSKEDIAKNRKALDKLVLAALTVEPQGTAKALEPATKPPAKVAAQTPAALDGSSLAAAGLGSRVSWVQAPLFDDDHPDDSAYNPFPVAPMVTETSSIDDPALLGLVHPSADKALELLAEESSAEPISIGTGGAATLAEAQAFAKEKNGDDEKDQGPIRVAQRSITTVKR